MSVEEAKKVTALFSGSAFVPPPRTIEDITAILDEQKREDSGAAEAARAKADLEPPSTRDAAVLWKFYFDRAMAAQSIGRVKQEIEDLNKALRYAGSGVDPPYDLVLSRLSQAEMRAGNYSRYLDYLRKAIASVPRNRRGALINYNSRIAMSAAGWGDLGTAEAAVADTSAVYYESRLWHNVRPEWLAEYEASFAQAQAAVFEAKGRYAEAEVLYRRALAALAADAVFSQRTWLDEQHAFVARTLILQGRLVEGESEARKAVLGALAKRSRYSPHTAWMLRALVWAILEQGRYAESETLARAVLDIYEKGGAAPESVFLAGARAQLASALSFQGKFPQALAEYERIRAGLAGDVAYGKRFLEGHLGYGVALLRNGKPEAALPVLNVALEKTRRLVGDRHLHTARIRGFIAQAHLARGERATALREFREASQVWLSQPLDVDDENATRLAVDQQLVTMLSFYIGLLADIRGTPLERESGIDGAAEAFRLAEVVRGRAVERALDANAARATAQTPALADLVRREQDVKKQLAAIQGLLRNVLSAPSDQQDARILEDLRGQFETLRRARQSLAQQIERDFPAYVQLVNPSPATIDQARVSLRPGEALISTVVLRDRTLVWAIPADGAPAFAMAPIGAKALAEAVAKLRAALDPSAKALGEIPAFDLVTAHELYRALLEPVAAAWQQAGSLLVVPHGPLGHLPFTLLVTKPAALPVERGALFSNYREVPWLVRGHAVTMLPSVGALATLRRLPAGDVSRRPFVGFGDPWFSLEQARRAARERPPADVVALTSRGAITLRNLKVEAKNSTRLGMLPRLPDTADEIRAIALALNADPTREVFLGAAANEHRVRTMNLAGYRVIAFATHGLIPGDLDGLTQPALALSAPEVANVEGDGLLTLEKILALRLNADWVVLSACNTASGQGSGSEAISGLGRAFFYAGARALLVSNWPVETTSARALTTELFLRQAANMRLSRAKVLQQTMNTMIDEGRFVDPTTRQVVFSYAHPIFWAPFTLVGDGGGS
ncbi:MAG: CHAT domain-containing protein [Proteobacteria bacterium]|nr:CHAT domain-containing protein [Pseudomonadota bacterium]